jgi:hypothetical protein
MIDHDKETEIGIAVVGKDPKSTTVRLDAGASGLEEHWWTEDKEFESWLEAEPSTEFEPEDNYFLCAPSVDGSVRRRLDQIRESHSLLRQFTAKELKVLMTLKRNTSAKAWTLREDLVVLTLSMSNREIAQLLQDRNKEAVKKRLQLLRSKGLGKRHPTLNESDVTDVVDVPG